MLGDSWSSNFLFFSIYNSACKLIDNNWHWLRLDLWQTIWGICWDTLWFPLFTCKIQNGHFSLTEGSSGNRLRVEFKLSLLKQFLFLHTILWLVNVNGKCTFWHKSPEQLISLCSLSCPWLPICDLDREVMCKCGSDLMTPCLFQDLTCSWAHPWPVTRHIYGIFLSHYIPSSPVMALIIH